MFEIKLRELELPRFNARLDLFDELQIGSLSICVVSLAGHRYVASGAIFLERRADFAPIDQPLRQVSHPAAPGSLQFQAIEQWNDLIPIPEIGINGYEATRGIDW
jgi:hypothetical protein